MAIEERMRRLLGSLCWPSSCQLTREVAGPIIEAHMKSAVEEEREDCAALVEECNLELKPGTVTKRTRKDYELCASLAAQIRARSESKGD